MNTELIQNLFDYLLANPETTEDVLIALTVQSSEHTTETASQWFNAFYKGLHKAMILDCASFDCMVSKIVNTEDLSLELIIATMEKYLIDNPLKYILQQEIEEIDSAIAEAEKLPDMVENTAKNEELEFLNTRKEELELELELNK